MTATSAFARHDLICVNERIGEEKVKITLRTIFPGKHVANVELLDQKKKLFLEAAGPITSKEINITLEYSIGTILGEAVPRGVYSPVNLSLREVDIEGLKVTAHTLKVRVKSECPSLFK